MFLSIVDSEFSMTYCIPLRNPKSQGVCGTKAGWSLHECEINQGSESIDEKETQVRHHCVLQQHDSGGLGLLSGKEKAERF